MSSASRGSLRRWTLSAAQQMLKDVRQRTEEAVREVEVLDDRRDGLAAESAERAAIEAELEQAVGRWVRAMEALGLEVKGPWVVDFDNGRGYYCWRWPEEKLEYFHGYEDGFAGRTRIQ